MIIRLYQAQCPNEKCKWRSAALEDINVVVEQLQSHRNDCYGSSHLEEVQRCSCSGGFGINVYCQIHGPLNPRDVPL